MNTSLAEIDRIVVDDEHWLMPKLFLDLARDSWLEWQAGPGREFVSLQLAAHGLILVPILRRLEIIGFPQMTVRSSSVALTRLVGVGNVETSDPWHVVIETILCDLCDRLFFVPYDPVKSLPSHVRLKTYFAASNWITKGWKSTKEIPVEVQKSAVALCWQKI